MIHEGRPWLFDDFDTWLKRIKGPSHKCAVVFLDNSGCDVVLGILPFVRELLTRGTKVRYLSELISFFLYSMCEKS